jgi:small-conductance mechanosensitive channel
MSPGIRRVLLGFLVVLPLVARSAAPAQPAAVVPREHVSPLTAEQLLQILDQTVDWYRTLGTQQQSATQPSDLLLLYANRQIADKVVALAFQVARANAELLSSEASPAQSGGTGGRSPQELGQLQQSTAQKMDAIQKEMQSLSAGGAPAPQRQKAELNVKLQELQGELAMVKAQKNLLDSMSQFVYENDSRRSTISALKARIDALAASIPAASAATASSGQVTGTTAGATTAKPNALNSTPGELGLWDLVADALRLSQKVATVEAVDKSSAALQKTFLEMRTAPNEQLTRLSQQSDQLAAAADSANGDALRELRDQFDRLAWYFTQTSAIALPLNQENVLLSQYRENLSNWRTAVKRQMHEVLGMLWTRLAMLLGALAAVFMGSELARRAILRYVRDVRYRNQLLLLRKLATWILVLLILGMTLITRLGSFATFAGLLTAGLAVAMQSVLVSVVGYFILIGKYGLRVGDRVQIGGVQGEVIDLGLIRMHLLELTPEGPLGPTGRVVAFANSIVFQSSGGLFRQIPGVNFTWHELTLPLPADADYVAVKQELLAAVASVIDAHRSEIVSQAEAIMRTTSSAVASDLTPQVQLRFSTSGVEAHVRYPVPLQRSAEIDERVSQRLHEVLRRQRAAPAN